jgi:diguanylate cyclase (GGDEF)-like protein
LSHPSPHRLSSGVREAERLRALARYDVLSGLPDDSFQRNVRLIAQFFRVPLASISFIDATRHWIRAGYGLSIASEDRKDSLCAQVFEHPGVFCLPDATQDPRFARNPFVTGAPGVRFYASAPLKTPDGHIIGALCIGDIAPRLALSTVDQTTLTDFASFIMNGLELRLKNAQLERESLAQTQLLRHLKSQLVAEETLNAVGELDAQELPVAEFLTRATERLSQAIDVDWSGLMVVDQQRALVHSVWHAPGQEKFSRLVSRGLRLDDHPGLAPALAGDQPIWLDDAETPGAALYDLTRAGLRSVGLVPLGEVGSLRYAMSFARLHSQGEWHPGDQGLVMAVARELRHVLSRRSQQAALSQSRAQLQLALSTAPLVLWATDLEGRVLLSEGRSLTSLGSSSNASVGRSIFELYPDYPQVERNVRRALAGESFEDTVNVAGLVLESRYQPLLGEDGTRLGSLGLSYDVTRLAQAEQEAQRSAQEAQRSAQEAQRSTREAQALLKLSEMLGGDGLLAAANASLEALHSVLDVDALALWQTVGEVGVALASCGGLSGEADLVFELVLDPQAPALLEAGPVYLYGPELPPELAGAGVGSVAVAPVSVAAQLALCAYRRSPRAWTRAESYLLEAAARMMSASLAQEQQLQHLRTAALTDTLTGLSNRRAFELDIVVDLARRSRDGANLSLVSIDLDGLKRLNDREGHLRGDQLLQAFAAALGQAFRQSDRVYRLGGDEYLVLISHTQPSITRSVQARFRRVLELTRQAGFADAGASLGLATSPADGLSMTELLRLSDERMYVNKHSRRKQAERRLEPREVRVRTPR